jgi:hypothetical protein
MKPAMTELIACGPDGSNPLGFLCTLGTFSILDEFWPVSPIRISWRLDDAWRPAFLIPTVASIDDLTSCVFEGLKSHGLVQALFGDPRSLLGTDLKAPPDRFLAFVENVARLAKPRDRILADTACAYGSEIVSKKTSKGQRIEPSQLCFTAGNQQFLAMEQELRLNTSLDDVRNALFSQWIYQDGCPSFRWDPTGDDRQYALRAADPAPEKTRSVRAANLLACEALRLFPTVPTSEGLVTTAFIDNQFYWPIWTCPLTLETTRSLLGYLPSLIGHPEAIESIGVAQVFVSRKVRYVGYYGNFTPATPV